ncbi:MAG: acyloxyacyl hydrolase [Candidatus Omnitrophica bacterium]|nr:acyloxyacyl hydrolase [Candidatus Omnitrophota bacterium]
MKAKTLKIFLALFCAVCFSGNYCFADEVAQPVAQPVVQEAAQQQELAMQKEEAKKSIFSSIDVLSGYAWSKLKAKSDMELKRDYDFYPVFVGLGFNLKNLTKRIGFNPPVTFEFQLEPYVAYVSSPDANVEFGNSFLLKLGLVPENWKLQLYAKAGVGVSYMTNHTWEQSTQFNFIESGGLGAKYFLTKNFALIAEGRMRHLSNAGVKQPNHGINTYFALAGVSYKY